MNTSDDLPDGVLAIGTVVDEALERIERRVSAAERPLAQPEFVVRLRALPDDVPWECRLRHFLKMALRSYRLRCIAVSAVETAAARARDRNNGVGA